MSGSQGVFTIDARTGVVEMNGSLDREEQSEVRLEIRATDDGNNTSYRSRLKPLHSLTLWCMYDIVVRVCLYVF